MSAMAEAPLTDDVAHDTMLDQLSTPVVLEVFDSAQADQADEAPVTDQADGKAGTDSEADEAPVTVADDVPCAQSGVTELNDELINIATDTRPNLVVHCVLTDGNCQFTSVASYLDESHEQVRAAVVAEVRAHSHEYNGFTADFDAASWANSMENDKVCSGTLTTSVECMISAD